MQWVITLGSTLITGILGINAELAALWMPTAAISEPDTTIELPTLADRTEPATIPRILIENTSYQQASLAAGTGLIDGNTAANPAEALVNIHCTYETDEYIKYTTGSGFFIAPSGVILTNAHVAQFLLLETVSETGTTECVVRHGNPAKPTYEAELLYISPAWVQTHAALIDDAAPKGTGERDYALLYLTTGVDNQPLPSQIPYVAVDTELRNINTIGDTVTIGGYPNPNADTLVGGAEIARQTATTTLADLYTFGSNYGDIYFLGGSNIGAQGISGGPVLNEQQAAIALITTRGDDTAQGAGSLNAITLSYIDRTIEEETGFGLSQTISGNLSYKAYVFQATLVPFLATLLEREL